MGFAGNNESRREILQGLIGSGFSETLDGVIEFIVKCDRANEIVIDELKPVLLVMIKSKISGRAGQELSSREFANWEELREWLKLFYNVDDAIAQRYLEEHNNEVSDEPVRRGLPAIYVASDGVDHVEIMSTKARGERFRLTLETACGVNVMKMDSITPDVHINSDDITLLRNVTLRHEQETLGSCWLPLTIDDRTIFAKFFIVRNHESTHIKGDGILGVEFFHQQKVSINFADRTFDLTKINKTIPMYET